MDLAGCQAPVPGIGPDTCTFHILLQTASYPFTFSPMAFSVLLPDLLPVFEALPDCYLVLSPELVILAVTDSYLKTTSMQREHLVGKHLFGVFPGQQGTPEADTLQQLAHSLQQVLDTKQPQYMPAQHYRLPDPEAPGRMVERYWKPLNTPVLDKTGAVLGILHKIEDIMDLLRQDRQLKKLTKLEEATEVIAQDNLREENRRFQEAQALAHIGNFEREIDGDISYWSDELYRIHGLEPQSEEITEGKVLSFVHPEDREPWLERIRIVPAAWMPIDLIHRIVRRDGTIRHVHRSATVIRDRQGKPLKVYGTVQDITGQMEAQEKLRASKALPREAEAVAHTGSYEGDLATGKFRFSDDMFRLLGYEPQSFEPTLDFIDSVSDPRDAARIRQVFKQAAWDKQPYQYTRRIYRPGGEMRYLSSNGKVICDAAGKAEKILGAVQDITEKKRAEEEIKKSKELLENVFNASLNGIEVFKPVRGTTGEITDFEWLLVNHTTERYTGRSDLKGQEWVASFPGVKSSGFFDQFKKVVEENQTLDFEHQYQYEGVEAWFRTLAVPFEDGLIATWIDITSRKKAEKELRASEERFRQLIDALPQMAWTAAVDGSSTYYNQRTFEYTGLNFEQIKDWGWAQAYPAEDRSQVEMEWKKAIASGQIYRKQSRMRRWDGAYRWQLVLAQPVRDQAGAITFWVGTVTDVHEQVLAEEKLQESRQLLKAVLDASINGIQAFKTIWNEANQIQDFEWILTNQVTDSFLQRNDLVGQRLLEQYPGTQKANIFEHLKQVAESGHSKQFEVWYDYEGFHHWFQYSLVKLGDGAAMTFQDITERKQLEEQQLQWKLQKQKELLHAILEAEEREKKRISESLHNGLGQILFAVRMQIGLIDPAEQPLNLEQKKAAWQKADVLVAQAIDLTRTISHELTPAVLEAFGLRTVIEDIGRSLSSSKLQLRCQVSMASTLEKHLQTAIYRITQELANNIIKHARATEATIAVEEKQGIIFIEAQDNGKGFELQKIPNKGMGLTGIGDRVKLLNGSFKIDSVIGHGTTVTIQLPLLPPS
jgi:PAS domain S-box-containing protein